MDKGKIVAAVLICLLMTIPPLGLLISRPARTFDYWQAWAYLAILFMPMTWMMFNFIKHDPELLERRMRMREQQDVQGQLIKFMILFFLATFLLPGFDRRFGWSNTPTWLSVVGLALVFVEYVSFFFVLRENS